ncbi:transaldolase family protein [Streptomyces sp. NPDC050418]|uniref:transaldolase family protein n=1 Tax=Streptomyces sp. NPDC050418 TaxID=3365612 RepID=UPI0037A7EB4B
MSSAISRLQAEGVSVWLEGPLTPPRSSERIRGLIDSGQATGLRVTSPARLDPQLARWACDVLLPVYDRTAGNDGLVAVPVAAGPTPDAAAHVAAARALVRAAARPNLRVRVPATAAGVAALPELLAEGIGVQVGPVFSPDRCHEVAEAHLAGLRRARQAGVDLATVDLGVEFAVGLLDTTIDTLLDKVGSDESKALRGRASVAGARLAYQVVKDRYDPVTSPRWAELAAAGARPQRLVWTSAYDGVPGRRATRYIEELVAAGTVVALPVVALDKVAREAEIVGARAHREHECSQRVLDYLRWFGIRYTDVVSELEHTTTDQIPSPESRPAVVHKEPAHA